MVTTRPAVDLLLRVNVETKGVVVLHSKTVLRIIGVHARITPERDAHHPVSQHFLRNSMNYSAWPMYIIIYSTVVPLILSGFLSAFLDSRQACYCICHALLVGAVVWFNALRHDASL